LHAALKHAKKRADGELRFHATYATVATADVTAARRIELTHRELKKLVRLP
jgi:hypothetical protein